MSLEYTLFPKIRVEKRDSRELIFYLEGGDQHTLPNLISKLALRKPHVVYAAYTIDHPLISNPRIAIVTDGERDPVDVLVEILNEAREYVERLKILLEERLE
ncbi:MAG: DNA-directed RNA polymerase subunit L [Sulfolobales archaeon]